MANTLGSNLAAKIDNRNTSPIWLVKIETPATTLYRTTWSENVSTTNPNPETATWTPEVMQVTLKPAQPNSSAEAIVQLSGNTTTLNYLLLEDLGEATITVYESQGDITYGTDDVLLRFVGQVDQARDKGGWGELRCINAFEYQYAPSTGLYITPTNWGPHLMTPGTYTIGGRTFVLEQEFF